jgi:hypothetical protein
MWLIYLDVIDQYFFQNFEFAKTVKNIGFITTLKGLYDPFFAIMIIVLMILTFMKNVNFIGKLQVLPVFLGGSLSLVTIVGACIYGFNNFSGVNLPINNWLWIMVSLAASAPLFLGKKISFDYLAISLLLLTGLLGTFLSLGYKGSFYGVGPLLALSTVVILILIENKGSKFLGNFVIASLFITSIWFLAYGASGQKYANPEFSSSKFTHPKSIYSLSGLILPTQQVEDFQELAAWIADINVTLAQFPAEDPILLMAPMSKPWSKCSQYIYITCTLSNTSVVEKFRKSPPDFLVIKNHIQIPWNPEPVTDLIQNEINQCFLKIHFNATYSVYESIC